MTVDVGTDLTEDSGHAMHLRRDDRAETYDSHKEGTHSGGKWGCFLLGGRDKPLLGLRILLLRSETQTHLLLADIR